jgi:hypothetical protein
MIVRAERYIYIYIYISGNPKLIAREVNGFGIQIYILAL